MFDTGGVGQEQTMGGQIARRKKQAIYKAQVFGRSKSPNQKPVL